MWGVGRRRGGALECAGGDFDIWRCVCVCALCVRCVGSLNSNNVGEEGGKAIGAALQHTPNMQELG